MTITNCQCLVAGYCPRHQINRTTRQHELCRYNQQYFDVWESTLELRGLVTNKECSTDRRNRVMERVARSARLKTWCKFLAIPDDKGLGDTIIRLLTKSKKRQKTIRSLLTDELKVYNCNLRNAANTMNEEYPYFSE